MNETGKKEQENKESEEITEEADVEVYEENETGVGEEKKEKEILEEAVEVEEKPAIEEAVKEEEIKPKREERPEEEIVEERVYSVPLSKAWIMPPNKRAPRAIRILKEFLKRHMKIETRKESEEEEEPRKLIITNEVNEKIWMKGIEKPPRKIRVRAVKDKDGNVTVYLAEGD